jgi:hypothetical protein
VNATGGPPDEHVRELVREILSQPPFDLWNRTELEVWTRLVAWFRNFVDWIDFVYVSAPILYWSILVGLLLVLAALVGHIVWSVRVALQAPEPDVLPETGPARPAWANEARALASEERFLEASHLLALGSVQSLIDGGHIDLSRSDANRALKQKIRAASLPEPLTREFLRLLDDFEARWFRDRGEDAALYEGWRELHARIETLPTSPK